MVDPKAIEKDIIQLQQKYENEQSLLKSFDLQNAHVLAAPQFKQT